MAEHPAAPPTEPASPAAERRPYREVTISAILFAIVIGVVMNAAITYAGLKIGFTIGGSAIAAVLGFGVLRGVLRRGSILETNIAQTAASAINTSNSGVIFTVPVLLLMGVPLVATGSDFWLITLACMAGAVLGAAFIIPLRKQMIDIDRLRFPTGTGVAVILKSPGAGAKKSIVLVVGILIAAAIYLPAGLSQLTSPADVNDLEALFETERISWDDVELTREIASWIEQEQAPESVTARGAALVQLGELRERLSASKEDTDRVGLEREIETLQQQVRDELSGDAEVSNGLAEAAFRASRETDEAKRARAWKALRDTDLGWAEDPMFGYADLGIRLPAVVNADEPARDQNGDGVPEPVLAHRVDLDANGRADLAVTDEHVDAGRLLGLPPQFQLVFAIAPFALGAGFITGRPGLLVLAGGILAYFVITPFAYWAGWMPETTLPGDAPGYGFGAFNRPLGIGLLLGGALMGVLASLPAIKEALKSVATVGRSVTPGGADELGLKPLVFAVIGAILLLFLAADHITNRPLNNDVSPISGEPVSAQVETATYHGYVIAFDTDETAAAWETLADAERDAFLGEYNAKPGWLSGLPFHVRSGLIAVIGALWIWFAGIIIAQCTGMTDWSPISGMALLTVVLVLLLAGSGAVIGAVLIGAALCVAVTLAADMMQDLRTGHLVGAKPRRQQIVELCVVGVGPVVSMMVILIIAGANMKTAGVPMGPGTPTTAPQAQALQAVIAGAQGGEMPYALYGFGALLGALLGLGAFSGLGVLVGLSMYLPFEYIATYGIGCVAQMIVSKVKGRQWAENWGVPFAAGLIVGESILSLVINLIVLAR